MEVVNPSMMMSRLDLVVLDSAVAVIDFPSTPLGFLEYWGIYRVKRRDTSPTYLLFLTLFLLFWTLVCMI